MGEGETGTLAAMKMLRRELWTPTIEELWTPTIERLGGRVVGGAGDSILVEFASAVAAVEASVAVQSGMVDRDTALPLLRRNATLPDDRRMLLRVGINIGEVIVDGDDIYGDGVNVAAGMQEIAEPGGIAISDIVRGQVHDKLDVSFADDGAHELKNIVTPLRVWRWLPTSAARERSKSIIEVVNPKPVPTAQLPGSESGQPAGSTPWVIALLIAAGILVKILDGIFDVE